MAVSQINGATINNAVAGASLVFAAQSATAGNDIIVNVSILDTTKSVTSITDTAGNSYALKASVNNGSSIRIETWAAHSITGNASNVVTVNFSGNTLASAAKEQYSGVSSYGATSTNTGSSRYPQGDCATQDANNWNVTGIAAATSSGDTFTIDLGTLRQNLVPALTTAGVALIDNSEIAQAAHLNNYATLSNSRDWATATLELRSGGSAAAVHDYVGQKPFNPGRTGSLLLFPSNGSLLAVEPTALQGAALTGIPNWGGWLFGNGRASVAYHEEWDMPGIPAVTYSLLSGSLPTGLALSAGSGNVGILSGTPTVAGTYTFTLRAVNVNGTVDKSFTIVISAAAAGGGSYTFLA